jgi:hypothetical protein
VIRRQNQCGVALAVAGIEGITGLDEGIEHRHITTPGGIEVVILQLGLDRSGVLFGHRSQ